MLYSGINNRKEVRMGIFNKQQKLVDNWKFEIVYEEQELLDQLKVTISRDMQKNTIVNFGTALDSGHRRLEIFTFASLEDGRLVTERQAEGEPIHVGIDLFESGNIQGLIVLESLSAMLSRGTRAFSSFEGLAAAFRIHGHHKDQPGAITVLGFERNGLFLVDRRDALNALRRDKELQLP